jgi:hypothetical protein
LFAFSGQTNIPSWVAAKCVCGAAAAARKNTTNEHKAKQQLLTPRRHNERVSHSTACCSPRASIFQLGMREMSENAELRRSETFSTLFSPFRELFLRDAQRSRRAERTQQKKRANDNDCIMAFPYNVFASIRSAGKRSEEESFKRQRSSTNGVRRTRGCCCLEIYLARPILSFSFKKMRRKGFPSRNETSIM